MKILNISNLHIQRSSLAGCYVKHKSCFGSFLICNLHAISLCYKYNTLFHTNLNKDKLVPLGTGFVASVNAGGGGGATAGGGAATAAAVASAKAPDASVGAGAACDTASTTAADESDAACPGAGSGFGATAVASPAAVDVASVASAVAATF